MDNLAFGLQITAVGMGVVFGLLAVLWLALEIAGRAERRGGRGAAGRPPSTPASAGAPSAAASDAVPSEPAIVPSAVRLAGVPESMDPRLVAAVTVAVLRHAETRRRQAAPAMRSYWPGSLLFASRWVAAGRMRQGQSWRRRPR